MTGYVFSLQATALTFRSNVDSLCGYPKPGVDIGGGIHVPPAQSVTVHAHMVLPHPTLAEWAHLISAEVSAVAAQAATASATVLPAVTTLDATWFPASVAL